MTGGKPSHPTSFVSRDNPASAFRRAARKGIARRVAWGLSADEPHLWKLRRTCAVFVIACGREYSARTARHGENPQRETRRAAREGASAITSRSNRPPRRTTEANIKGNSSRTKGCRNRCVLPWAPIRLLGKEPFSCAMRPCVISPLRVRVHLRRLRAIVRPQARWHLCRDARR